MVASGSGTISVSSSIRRLAPENVFVVQVDLHYSSSSDSSFVCAYIFGV